MSATPSQFSLKGRPLLPLRVRLGRALRRALLTPVPRTWELRYLMWENGRGYKKALARARAQRADHEKRQELHSEWADDYHMLEEEYEAIYSRRLVRKAIRLRVPVPDRPYGAIENEDENWRHGHLLGEWYLKPEGIKKVKTEIRAEREARRAWVNLLIGVIGTLAGLLAAAAGLVAVWRH